MNGFLSSKEKQIRHTPAKAKSQRPPLSAFTQSNTQSGVFVRIRNQHTKHNGGNQKKVKTL
jgi:hypothetical protein